MDQSDWTLQFSYELDRAEAARNSGNEGMARVCARRAVGIVIGEYLLGQEHATLTPSVVDRLHQLIDSSYVTDQVKEVAGHFLQRVNPDFKLPVDADLITEARWLAQELLKKPQQK